MNNPAYSPPASRRTQRAVRSLDPLGESGLDLIIGALSRARTLNEVDAAYKAGRLWIWRKYQAERGARL